MEFRSSICKSFYIRKLRLKWQKSDDVDSMNYENDEDLMFLTFIKLSRIQSNYSAVVRMF